MKYRFLFIIFLSVFFINKSIGQVTVTSSDSVTCINPCTMLTAHVVGDSPINAGVTMDDIYSDALPIGFTFTYFGVNYTSCSLGANGTIDFNAADAGGPDPWTISGPLAGNVSKYNNICGPWCDIDIFYTGSVIGTENYSTDGVAPNRKFVVTWCGCSMFQCSDQKTTTQIILYEGTNIIEVHVAHKDICTSWNPDDPAGAGGRAIIGVEGPESMGGAAVVAPGRDWTPVWSASDEAWRFAPIPGTTYSVTAIPYSPVPYAINPDSIYWYNATTDTYLGVGDSMHVCPTGPTLYRAGKLGCADTSFGNYFVDIVPINIVATPFNPTKCGGADGFIIIGGLEPGATDVVSYLYNGVAQSYTGVVTIGGTLTLNNLMSGVYSNIIVSQNACNTIAVDAVLINPPISITSIDINNPSYCGVGDGSLVLHGLYSGTTFLVAYDFNGVAQPVATLFSDPTTGDVTLPSLYQGVYTNIVASIMGSPDSCVTAPMGPYTLTPPPLPIKSIDSIVPASQCGYFDGIIYLGFFQPYSADTINYTFNGVAQTPLLAITQSDSTIKIPGLPKGIYADFTVTIGECTYIVSGAATITAPTVVASFDTIVHLGCHGDTVFFTNTSSQYFDGTAVAPGPLYYIWSFGDGTADTSASPYHIYMTQGTYNVSLVADNHRCIDTAVMTIPLIHPLFDSFTASTYIVCQDSVITFTNNSSGTTGQPVYYDWYFGDGSSSTDVNPTHSFANTGSYSVQLVAHDYVPCYDTFTAIVQTDTLSGIRLLATDTVICQGTDITFTGLYSSIGNTGVTWNFGDGDSVKNVNPVAYAYNNTGNFTITTTATYRACDNVSTTRNINVLPTPVINLGHDTSICEGSGALILEDRVNGPNAEASWLWNTGATTPAISVNTHGLYWATVNISNCYATDSVNVLNDCYMDLPNVFSPNNDGVNDYFYPRQFLSMGLIAFKMEVYNRWGQNIYEATTVDGRGWDGKFNGVDQPEGVYIYVIDATFKDGQKEHHQGNMTLLR